jgi:hypothetical protein
MIILSTSLELIGVGLVGITIIHLLLVRHRISSLQRASRGRADELVEIIADAAHKNVTLPGVREISFILLGLVLNIVGISLRLMHDVFAWMSAVS